MTCTSLLQVANRLVASRLSKRVIHWLAASCLNNILADMLQLDEQLRVSGSISAVASSIIACLSFSQSSLLHSLD